MKYLFSLLFLTGSLLAQGTVSVPLTAVIQNADVADIYAWMHMQFADAPVVPTLSAPMLIGATTATLTSVAGLSAGGGGIMIEAEGIQYTGISGNQLTGLIRGQQMTVAAAHPTSSAVHNLAITSPDAYVKYAIAYHVSVLRKTLGENSAAVGAAMVAIRTNTAIVNAFPVVQ